MIRIVDKKDIKALEYAFYETPFGMCLTVWSDGVICDLSFSESMQDKAIAELQERWKGVVLKQAKTPHYINFNYPATLSGHDIILTGTPFQIKVWRALCDTKMGQTESYSQLAVRIGAPSSVRAAASAVASNKIAILVPCHRIIRSNGNISGFRWGTEMKRQLLEWEKRNA